jgi:hypothetical protein
MNMTITLAEVLKSSGWSQTQIDALDAKAMSGLTDWVSGVEKTAAEKEQAAKAAAEKAEADRKAAEAAAAAAKEAEEKAALSKRSVDEFWQNTYNPGMAGWEKERQELAKKAADASAEAAFYKAQREGYLGTLGIKPEDAPVFKPAEPVKKVEPETPGTPKFIDPNVIVSRVGDGMNTISDIQWKYQTLYGGAPLPIPPSELIKQADALKLSPMEYAARTFKFAEKEAERRAAEAKAHDDKIAADAVAAKEEAHKAEVKKLQDEFAAKERLRAEQGGSNGDVRTPPGSSKFADLQRATKAGERKDPTRMTPEERRQTTLANVHKAIEEREQQVA